VGYDYSSIINNLSLSFFIMSATIFVLIIAMAVILIMIKISMPPKHHRETLIIGFIAICCLSYFAFSDSNISLDNSKANIVEGKIIDMYTTKHRRARISYHIIIVETNQEHDLSVNQSFYDGFITGERVLVYKHDGFFGFEWIEKIESSDWN